MGCLEQHMTALNHWFTDKCDTCDRRFVNKMAAVQHMDAFGHRSSPYCRSCERYFQNPTDLFQHMNSPIQCVLIPSMLRLHRLSGQFLSHDLHLATFLRRQLWLPLLLDRPQIPTELHALTLSSTQYLLDLLLPLLQLLLLLCLSILHRRLVASSSVLSL
jgi:hypothetical protein